MKVFISLVVTFALVSAECPRAQDDFTLSKLAGTWYTQYSSPDSLTESSCIQLSLTPDEDKQGVLNFAATDKTLSSKGEAGRGTVTQSGNGGVITITSAIPPGATLSTDSAILSTDYKNYYIISSCSADPNEKWGLIGVMTRERVLSPDVKQLIEDAMTSIGGPSLSSLTRTVQENCS